MISKTNHLVQRNPVPPLPNSSSPDKPEVGKKPVELSNDTFGDVAMFYLNLADRSFREFSCNKILNGAPGNGPVASGPANLS